VYVFLLYQQTKKYNVTEKGKRHRLVFSITVGTSSKLGKLGMLEGSQIQFNKHTYVEIRYSSTGEDEITDVALFY
jgi:hypothetical protein